MIKYTYDNIKNINREKIEIPLAIEPIVVTLNDTENTVTDLRLYLELDDIDYTDTEFRDFNIELLINDKYININNVSSTHEELVTECENIYYQALYDCYKNISINDVPFEMFRKKINIFINTCLRVGIYND